MTRDLLVDGPGLIHKVTSGEPGGRQRRHRHCRPTITRAADSDADPGPAAAVLAWHCIARQVSALDSKGPCGCPSHDASHRDLPLAA